LAISAAPFVSIHSDVPEAAVAAVRAAAAAAPAAAFSAAIFHLRVESGNKSLIVALSPCFSGKHLVAINQREKKAPRHR